MFYLKRSNTKRSSRLNYKLIQIEFDMRTCPILCTLYNIHDTYVHENLF